MSSRIQCLGLGFLCLALLPGCGPKLNETKKLNLPQDGAFAVKYELPPQTRDQKITLDISVSGDAVDLFVMKDTDIPDPMFGTDSERKKFEAAAMLSKRNIKAEKATVTVPANTKVTVVVILADVRNTKTEGTLKMTN